MIQCALYYFLCLSKLLTATSMLNVFCVSVQLVSDKLFTTTSMLNVFCVSVQ